MGWQLRHKEFGVYQGNCLGLGFWHPMSGMPEQGYCEFEDEESINEYIDFLCSDKCTEPLIRSDLSIEPFNKEESDKIMAEARLDLILAGINPYDPRIRA
jgi:hypothetical protein